MFFQDDLPAISPQALKAFRAAAPEIIKETMQQSMRCKEDIAQHGDQAESLITAGLGFTTHMLDSVMAFGATALMTDELTWAADRLPHDGVTMQQVTNRLKIYRQIVIDKLSPGDSHEVAEYIDWMIVRLESPV